MCLLQDMSFEHLESLHHKSHGRLTSRFSRKIANHILKQPAKTHVILTLAALSFFAFGIFNMLMRKIVESKENLEVSSPEQHKQNNMQSETSSLLEHIEDAMVFLSKFTYI